MAALAVPTDKKDRAKARRATFANCIHQKDASIATHVVYACLIKNIRVYTVYDNLISPAEHAQKIPSIVMHSKIWLTLSISSINLEFSIYSLKDPNIM